MRVFIFFFILLVACKSAKKTTITDRNVAFIGDITESGELLIKIKYAKSINQLVESEILFLNQKFGEESKEWKILEKNYLVNGPIKRDIFKIQTFKPDSIFNVNFDLQYFKGR